MMNDFLTSMKNKINLYELMEMNLHQMVRVNNGII
jgi:hypothetical protein